MRILIVRPDAIGDVVLMVPLLNTVRQAYPDAEIYTLQQPYTIPLLQHHPSVTAVIPDWKKMGKAKGPSGFFAYARYLRSFGFSIVFLPYLEPYYLALMIVARIPIRVGDGNKVLLRPFLTHSIPIPFRNLVRHESEHAASLIWALRPEVMLDTSIALSGVSADGEGAAAILAEFGVEDRYIVVHPRSGGGNRPWLPAKYAETIDAVAARLSAQVILTGSGPAEMEVIADIRNRATTPIIDLSGRTALPVLIALVQNAAVVIGTDTGPTHIAAALGVPVVSVSPTKFVKALRWGPWNTLNQVVSRSDSCQLVCSPYRCKKTICLDAISSETVTDAIVSLASRRQSIVAGLPSKHQWMKTSMHLMMYWSGQEPDLPVILAQYRLLIASGFVVHLAVRAFRLRRLLVEALGIAKDEVAVVPVFDWVRMIRFLNSRDVTAVYVVGPLVGWYWSIIRQLCGFRQYCPPVVMPMALPDTTEDEAIIRLVDALDTA